MNGLDCFVIGWLRNGESVFIEKADIIDCQLDIFGIPQIETTEQIELGEGS